MTKSPAGKDENSDRILYLNGAGDISRDIRIVNYTPTDGSCLVGAYGTLINPANGEPALSMDGYTN